MSQNSRNQGFSYYICSIIEGSGSGSRAGSGRPKNTWIRWIRIRNTDCKTAARPPNNCVVDWWGVTLSYDKRDVTKLAKPPDVLHGWEAGAGVIAVVEHRRLRAVRQLHMLGLTQRAATYIFLSSGLRIRIISSGSGSSIFG
jgi:hypothetical protein